MNILIVEDDLGIAQELITGLNDNNFNCVHATNGEAGLEFALKNEFQLIITDLMLPGMNGLEMISELRKNKVDAPVLILTAKRSLDDRVTGLQNGGDDYLVKPYAFVELLARIKNLIRRSTKEPEAKFETLIFFEDLTINLISREVTREQKKIELQAKEYQLLEFFIKNIRIPLSKNQILEKIWGYSFDPQTNVVDVLVYRLRGKVDKNFSKPYIHTLKGIGYVFKVE
ncbi:MAG: response regulator transcription factor [Bdellovibrio sp.]|nr:response regulator transcription factor [Bdellovibrio sp.]